MLFGTISEKISIVISQAILWIFGHWYQTIGKITKNFSTAWSSGQGSWHRGQNLLIPELQGHYESYQKGSENHGCYFLFLWSLAGLVLLLIWTILQTTFRLLPLTTHGMDIFDINTHCPPEKTWVKPVKLCSITWNPAWSSFRHGLVVRKKLLINPCSGLVTLIRNILCFLKLHQVKYSKKIRIETDFFTRTNGMV